MALPDAGCYEFLEYGSYIILNEGWNFISVPKLSPDMTSDYLFPTRISQVFEFNNIYLVVNELENGKGYAVKFDQPQFVYVEGEFVSFPIQVSIGWNIIGPFHEDVVISQITSLPPEIITSNFFSFNGIQYVVEDILNPGKGYWVKVSENGMLNFDANSIIEKVGKQVFKIGTK